MIIRLLRPTDRRESFTSGKHSLDDFFHRHALNNHIQGISKVYVAVERDDDDDVLGYFALSAADVESRDISALTDVSLPGYPIPAFIIGRLAVDRSAQGRGVGRTLITEALRVCLTLSRSIATFGVIVDALDEEVVTFYERYGFVVLPPERFPQRMFLPMSTIKAATEGGDL